MFRMVCFMHTLIVILTGELECLRRLGVHPLSEKHIRPVYLKNQNMSRSYVVDTPAGSNQAKLWAQKQYIPGELMQTCCLTVFLQTDNGYHLSILQLRWKHNGVCCATVAFSYLQFKELILFWGSIHICLHTEFATLKWHLTEVTIVPSESHGLAYFTLSTT